ncbi:hypothetical protein ACP70R_045997 [Stipagrostis hirtigluma subsp. patula]
MAENPEALTEYERRRQDNIRRNQAILAQLRRDAADVSAAARPKKQPRAAPAAPAAATRRSGRARAQPPPPSSAAALPSARLKPRPAQFPIPDAFVGRAVTDASAPLTSAILAAAWPPGGEACAVASGSEFDPDEGLALKPGKARKLAETMIAAARVLPLADRTVVAAGTLQYLVFWDADCPAPAPRVGAGGMRGVATDGVFTYRPHAGSVAAITAHSSAPRKIYSCSDHGEICLMDVEKGVFGMICLCNYPLYSLCQAPDNATCLYFGEGNGQLKAFDERAGNVSSTWRLHRDCISSIDFNPENPYMLATSSLDRTACLWDLRNMKMLKPKSLKLVKHKERVQSAYFSPSGSFLATTIVINTVAILSVRDFNISCSQQNFGPWTTFKASWGWNDSDLLLGTQRGIQIISVDLKDDNISTTCKSRIESEHITGPLRLCAVHPYRVGYLACVGRKKVFLWTPEQDSEQKDSSLTE